MISYSYPDERGVLRSYISAQSANVKRCEGFTSYLSWGEDDSFHTFSSLLFDFFVLFLFVLCELRSKGGFERSFIASHSHIGKSTGAESAGEVVKKNSGQIRTHATIV